MLIYKSYISLGTTEVDIKDPSRRETCVFASGRHVDTDLDVETTGFQDRPCLDRRLEREFSIITA